MAKTNNKIPDLLNPLNVFKLFVPLEIHEYFEDVKQYPFNNDATGHDNINAWWLAEFSSLVYDNKRTVIGCLTDVLKISKTDIKWIEGKDTQGFIIDYQGDYIISFRGTEFYRPGRITPLKFLSVLADIKTDLMLHKINDHRVPDSTNNTVNVHAGFHNALEDVWSQLTGFINNKATQNIWLTGHSLGGALATITAMRLHTRVKGLYTYGCPCVGGDTLCNFFSKNLAGKIFRYVNDNDFVAKGMESKPFKNLFPGYMHVGESKKLKTEETRSLIEIPGDSIGLDIIDHSPLFYLHGTRKNI